MGNSALRDISSVKLRSMLLKGYQLIEENNIYFTPKVYKSNETEFSPKSFTQFVAQGWNAHQFTNWEQELKLVFKDANLNFARFKARVTNFDQSTDSSLPAAVFKRMVRELDEIVNDANTLKSYTLSDTFPAVEFVDGVICQGYKKHKFTHETFIDLLKMLWDGRKILTPEGTLINEATPIPREQIYKKLNIRHDRFTDVVRAIESSSKRKGILLEIKYPDMVYMVVRQDLT